MGILPSDDYKLLTTWEPEATNGMGIHMAEIPPDVLIKQMKVRVSYCRCPFIEKC